VLKEICLKPAAIPLIYSLALIKPATLFTVNLHDYYIPFSRTFSEPWPYSGAFQV